MNIQKEAKQTLDEHEEYVKWAEENGAPMDQKLVRIFKILAGEQ